MLAVGFGVFLTVVLIAQDGASAQAFLPLVFAAYGVIHLLVLTDVVERRRRRNRHDRDS